LCRRILGFQFLFFALISSSEAVGCVGFPGEKAAPLTDCSHFFFLFLLLQQFSSSYLPQGVHAFEDLEWVQQA
jgi:hypothetical protein